MKNNLNINLIKSKKVEKKIFLQDNYKKGSFISIIKN